MSKRALFILAALSLALALTATAKDQPVQTLVWPETGSPVLRFSFTKFKELGGMGNQRTYTTSTTAENLWTKTIPNANFALYLFDKNKVRIGEATLTISNVGAGETVKFETTIAASGPPASISIAARYLPPELGPAAPAKMVSLTVNSVPQGAALKVDGNESGVTPKLVRVTVGKHLLEFTKEGFSVGKFPFEIGPDDASGGSVSYELGASSHDTIELRDGSVLSGDLVSVTAMDVVIRVGGKDQNFDRNQIKRIIFVQREKAEPGTPASSQP